MKNHIQNGQSHHFENWLDNYFTNSENFSWTFLEHSSGQEQFRTEATLRLAKSCETNYHREKKQRQKRSRISSQSLPTSID